MTTAESPVDLRRERLMMRAFQNPLLGPVLRKLINPQAILEDGMSFWSSRLILTAVDRGVFTLLAEGPLSARTLIDELGWHSRAATTALDALVAAGMLRRDKSGRYSNTPPHVDVSGPREVQLHRWPDEPSTVGRRRSWPE